MMNKVRQIFKKIKNDFSILEFKIINTWNSFVHIVIAQIFILKLISERNADDFFVQSFKIWLVWGVGEEF